MEYENVRTGRLVLKGEKQKSKKRKHKKQEKNEGNSNAQDADAVSHGGWYEITKVSEMSGTVAIEFGNHVYIKALDNGLFTVGIPHNQGEGPSPEEILTAIPVNETKVALKSGYGKYLGVDKKGVVAGRSDAVGALEQWEPIFQDGKLAILSSTNCFVSVTDEDDVVCQSKTAGPSEFVRIRSMVQRLEDPNKNICDEEQGSLAQVEEKFVSNIRKEKKKEDQSTKSGASADEIYHSKLWYFQSFDFLNDQSTPRQSSSNLDSDDENSCERDQSQGLPNADEDEDELTSSDANSVSGSSAQDHTPNNNLSRPQRPGKGKRK